MNAGPQHAHALPLSLRDDQDGQQRIDHILIHSPMGLGDDAQRAIRTMRETWTKGGVGDLQVALAASGDIDMLRALPEPLAPQISRLLGPKTGCSEWVSLTPFVPPRFLKKNGSNSLMGQVNAELRSRGLPEAVEVFEDLEGTKAFRHFVLSRQHGGTAPPRSLGLGLRLTFAEPLSISKLPLTLGYGSHFGPGLFVAREHTL